MNKNKSIKNIAFEIEIPIYKIYLRVIVGDDNFYKKMLNKLNINMDEIKDDRTLSAEALQCYNKQGILFPLIRFREIDFTPGSWCEIVHEVSHVTFYVLGDAGIQVDKDNSEPFAYLNEFIFYKVVDRLKNYYDKLK